jgi:phenylalanine-4-hydroxylase
MVVEEEKNDKRRIGINHPIFYGFVLEYGREGREKEKEKRLVSYYWYCLM